MYKKTCLALAVLALGGCRIVSQQELADLKSPPNPHMANIDKNPAAEHRAAGGRQRPPGGGVDERAEGAKRYR